MSVIPSRVRNTSQFPTQEVLALLEFGFHGLNLEGVQVNVKNSGNAAYKGRAYSMVPHESPYSRVQGVRRLITIGLGSPGWFPTTNLSTSKKSLPAGTTYEEALAEKDRQGAYAVEPTWFQHNPYLQKGWALLFSHGYGGKRSPIIHYQDWKEALVAIAAHEARHIHQFRNRLPLSEVDCEKWALKKLERYRAAQA